MIAAGFACNGKLKKRALTKMLRSILHTMRDISYSQSSNMKYHIFTQSVFNQMNSLQSKQAVTHHNPLLIYLKKEIKPDADIGNTGCFDAKSFDAMCLFAFGLLK